jgi:hypothetical protein
MAPLGHGEEHNRVQRERRGDREMQPAILSYLAAHAPSGYKAFRVHEGKENGGGKEHNR